MGQQNFSVYLVRELTSVRLALLTALEEKDRLVFVEAAALRNDYMAKIGTYEETVMEAELDVVQLERKAELIQSSLNRRELVDMQAIEAKLEEEQKQMLEQIQSAEKAVSEFPQLSEEEQKKLQATYRQIIDDYHPQLNPNLTQMQKELYQKALDAYKRQNVEALVLVRDMLYDASEIGQMVQMAAGVEQLSEEERIEKQKQEIEEISEFFATDYSFAVELMDCFSLLESDVVLQNAIGYYKKELETVTAETDEIRGSFPFNAEETLADPEKVEAYIRQLQSRSQRSEEAKQQIQQKIKKMLGGTVYD